MVHNPHVQWQIRRVGADYCTLQPGQVTRAVQHRSVEEVTGVWQASLE
jgi:hypothetical protein